MGFFDSLFILVFVGFAIRSLQVCAEAFLLVILAFLP